MPFGGSALERAGGFLRWGGTGRKVGRTAHPEIRMRRFFAIMFALATLTACGENGVTGTTVVNIVGDWRLQSVNGSPLTYIQQTGTTKLEVFSGTLVISASGNYTVTLQERITTNGSSSVTNATTFGTVDISGAGLLLKRSDRPADPAIQAELTTTTIGFVQDGLTLLFTKS